MFFRRWKRRIRELEQQNQRQDRELMEIRDALAKVDQWRRLGDKEPGV